MQYLLDTNICIYLIKQKPEKVIARFQTLSISDIGISSITVAELEYGVYKSQKLTRLKIVL
jgi:tRNA(fMet)-specific endonuclease VapC